MAKAENVNEIKFSDAKQEYNQIFSELGLDYLTIGNDGSCYKNTKYWNLRDLVSEAEYQYSRFLDSLVSTDFDLLITSDREKMNHIACACRQLRNFVDKYKHSIQYMCSFDRHSTRFDRLSLGA